MRHPAFLRATRQPSAPLYFSEKSRSDILYDPHSRKYEFSDSGPPLRCEKRCVRL